jgi:hypothetical protein
MPPAHQIARRYQFSTAATAASPARDFIGDQFVHTHSAMAATTVLSAIDRFPTKPSRFAVIDRNKRNWLVCWPAFSRRARLGSLGSWGDIAGLVPIPHMISYFRIEIFFLAGIGRVPSSER